MNRPNILFVMPDQHRASALGCAGDPVVRTPNLDGLASRGARFDHCYSQGSLCMPARASFITERYVRDHGVFENSWDVPAELPTFVQRIRDAGYHTSCIGKMHLYRHGAGAGDTREHEDAMRTYGFTDPIEAVGKIAAGKMGSPYADYLQEIGLWKTYREFIASHSYTAQDVDGTKVKPKPLWDTESVPLPVDAYIDSWIGRRAVQWVDDYDSDDPFFLWVGFAGPHDPWDAPAEVVELFRHTDPPLGSLTPPEIPPAGPWKVFLDAFMAFSGSEYLTPEVVREIRRYYYADVAIIDGAVGAILDALRRRELLENTWIVYTSDHGEMLGDHKMLAKMVFYEAAVQVPLIVRPPGGNDGKVITDLVEHVDLAATLRAIAGAADVPQGEGRSLLGHFAGDDGFARRVCVSESFGFAMFRTDRYKLVVYEDELDPVQLFDLEADPNEDRNLIADPAYAEVLDDLVRTHVRPFFVTPPQRPVPGILSLLMSR